MLATKMIIDREGWPCREIDTGWVEGHGGLRVEGWGGLEIEADSGLGVEGFGGLR